MVTSSPVHTEEHACSWYAATANRQTNYPALKGKVKADVCIVGGGFSGVGTALALAEKGYRVVVLEARKIAWGATGRSGGQLIRGLGESPERYQRLIGREGVEAINRMGFESVERVRSIISRYRIQCDLQMGYLDAALKQRHMTSLAGELDLLKQQGYPHRLRLLQSSELSKVIGSSRYIGGLVDEGSGHLHPMNLCLGEVDAAEKLGVLFYEHSRVTAMKSPGVSGKHQVITGDGVVESDFVVLCGNAYLGSLEPRLNGKVLPAGSYIIATEPLSEAVRHEILPENYAVCDHNALLHYFRLSADGRLLFGGRCNYTGHDPKSISGSLLPRMKKIFPQLDQVTVDYEWGGWIGISANRIPQIGRLSPTTYYAQGYSGHGVNATHMAAQLIAEAIDGQAGRFDVFDRIRHHRFPGGENLRSPMLAIGMLWYQMKDLLP